MFGDNLKRIGGGMRYGCKIGKHNDVPDSAFDQKELAMGIKSEMEHTNDAMLAKKIAKDHLAGEDPHYYSKLLKAGL